MNTLEFFEEINKQVDEGDLVWFQKIIKQVPNFM